MTIVDYKSKSFEELMHQLFEEGLVTSYGELRDSAIYEVQEGRLELAIHILQAIVDDSADWYEYDWSMGTMETPTGLTKKEHVEHLIEEDV